MEEVQHRTINILAKSSLLRRTNDGINHLNLTKTILKLLYEHKQFITDSQSSRANITTRDYKEFSLYKILQLFADFR